MNTPVQQLPSWMDRPKRWPLVAQPGNRSDSPLKDARMLNCFAERDPDTGEYQVQKRIGYTLSYTATSGFPQPHGAGIYTWGPTGGAIATYAIFSNGLTSSLFKNGVIVGASSLSPMNLGQKFFFAETQGVASQFLIFASPQNVYYTDGGVTWNTAPIPTHGPIVGVGYLDGTIYFMDRFCKIYGSNIDDPTTWNGLNLVIANTRGGYGVGLVQLLQYIIALKSNSMEVFYDAANPVGSPLSPVSGALSNYGCADSGTIQVIDNILLYATSNQTVSPQIVRVDNLATTIVSSPQVERLLSTIQEANLAGTIFSWVFKYGGHRFYGISSSFIDLTMVYDLDQNLWYQWSNPTASVFPLVGMAYSQAFFHVAQGWDDGNVYLFEGDYKMPTDNGVISPVEIYTPNTDFGTRRQKTLHRMYIRSDQTPGSILQVRRSDDDYQTWSNFRNVNLAKKTPYMQDEGTFVKRAYHFRHACPTPFRIRSADLQADFGTI